MVNLSGCLVFYYCAAYTVTTPFGELGGSQLSSNDLPCSFCSTLKLASPAGEASRVLVSTHWLDTLPEGVKKKHSKCNQMFIFGMIRK